MTATDNSGQVQVQLRLDDKPFGGLLISPPFEVTLNPSLIYSGNHVLYAVARDPAGNATVSNLVYFRSEGGLANLDGEIFLSDRVLPGVPFGVTTDNQNNVYVTSHTGQITKFDPQGRMLAAFKLPPYVAPFNELAGMGKDYAGNLLILDRDSSSFPPGAPRVHSLSPATGMVTTLGNLSKEAQINARFVLNLDTGQFEDMTAPVAFFCNSMPQYCYYVPEKGVDIAGSPDGSILVGVEGQIDPRAGNSEEPYLVRIRGPYGNSVLARSSTFFGGRGVAVDSNGQIFTVFPRTSELSYFDSLTRFPPAFPYQAAQPLFYFSSSYTARGMDIDQGGRIYITLGTPQPSNGVVVVFSGGQTSTLLGAMNKKILADPHDVAVDNRGNIYVTSTESRTYGTKFYPVARITRFGEIFSGLSALDTDGDGILDDGNGSGIAGDAPCLNGQTTSCDDNCQFNKNANQSDNDGDGVGDVCDPDSQCKVGVDTDRDGISDCDELQIYKTDPNLADTDGDGLGDGVEVGLTGFDADPATTTDPLKRDTDGDGRLDGNNGIDPCEDCNNNGRVDAGESDPGGREGFVALVAGLNLFSYPGTVPAQYATCTNLLTALGATNQVDSLSRFNPASQRFEECGAGNNFAVKTGEAYMVVMKMAKEVALRAQPVCPSLNLAAGLNLIGHPSPQTNLRCFGLLNGFGANVVATIQRFNGVTGRFEACTWDQGRQAAGVDFPIVTGEGYLFHMAIGVNAVLPGCGN